VRRFVNILSKAVLSLQGVFVADPTPKKEKDDELMTFDDDGDGWADDDADWGDLEGSKFETIFRISNPSYFR